MSHEPIRKMLRMLWKYHADLDCTVVAYFMVFQKQIGKIGTPFLTVLSLCGHNDPPSGVFGIFMLFIKTIKLEKHCLPNLIICLLSTQVENSILAGRIT